MNENSIGDAIAAARKKQGLSQTDLARRVGVTPQAVQKWEAGGGPRGSRLNAVAQALGLSLTELLTAASEVQSDFGPSVQTPLRPVHAINNMDEAEHELITVPRITLRASAGRGAPVLDVDLRGEPNYARRSWAQREGLNPDHLFSIVAVGDSMEPTILDGDSLIVHQQCQVENNRIAVICFRGECYVKRLLQQMDGSLVVRSDNRSSYHDMIIPSEQMEELMIVGRVVNISRSI